MVFIMTNMIGKPAYRTKISESVKEARKNIDCYLYLLPLFFTFFLFTILPVLIAVFFSFTYFNLLETPIFTGWNNYLSLFLDDDVFLTALKNTLLIALITGPVGYLGSFLLAWFINELNRVLRAVIVTLLYSPALAGGAFMIWTLIFSGDAYGYLNSFLFQYGLIDQPVQWLTDPNYMIWCVIIVMIWVSLGAGFLAFVAGFQTIDKSMYEAGYVDGIKNRWQELWFITLPSMRSQLVFGAVMSITASFSVGELTSHLCGMPSTDFAAHTIVNHLTDYGTVQFDMGYACAIATVLFMIMFFANMLIQRLINKVGN